MRFRILFTIIAVLGVSALLAPVPVATADEAAQPAMTSEAMAIVESCSDCHDLDTPGYTHNPHGILNMDADLAARYGVAASCNGCHGDMAEHIESGGETPPGRTFGDDVPATLKASTCLQCHNDAHPRFGATTHAQAGMACTDCHSVHGSDSARALPLPMEGVWQADLADQVGAANAMCNTCHGDVFAEFEWNERHRLQEGILGCNDCHSPHEPQSRVRLGGFKQQQCAQCHTDKVGPFVFEHGSVQIEGCTSCHTPHGSPNRHMLKFQNVAELCFSCHAAVPSFHARFTVESQCTNCHSSIHGSNFHEAFLK